MTLKTRRIRVNLHAGDGAPSMGASVIAQLVNSTTLAAAYDTDGGIIVPTVVSTSTDTTGTALLHLWPNALGSNSTQYQITIVTSGKLLAPITYITVPDGDEATEIAIETIIGAAPYPAIDAALQAVIDAQAQVDIATTQAGIATGKAVLTAADAVATAADRVQTGLDRTAASASATSAAASAVSAAASAALAPPSYGTGVPAALATNVGTDGAPVIKGGVLGTPSSGDATHLTGTASGLTAGTVTTNANLTGPVTSTGNTTAIANGAITNAMLANAAVANLSGTNTGDQDLSGLVPKTTTVNGHALSGNVSVTASDVGLGNVDNTSDVNKPVSTAQATALAGKATTAQGDKADTALQPAAIGVTVQAYDADLTTWAGVTPGTGITAALATNIGTDGAPVIKGGVLGTPSSGDATHLTGTASGLTAGTVTTNANLSGPVTSTGNTTAIANGAITNAMLANAAVANLSGTNTGDQDLSGLVPKTTTVNGHALSGNVSVTASDVGLGNVDNTSDVNKPVSTAQATALAGKATTAQGDKADTALQPAAIGVTVQAYDADLTTWAGVTPGTGITAALATNIGTDGAPVIKGGVLGTPSSGDATHLTGTASGLTAGTVTTNANLSGPVTSVGNTTAIASGAITNAMLANSAVANLSGTNTGDSASIPIAQSTLVKDPTGFSLPDSVIANYNSTTRTVTLTGSVEAHWNGTLVSALVSGWVSAAHTATVGGWFLYYNGSAFVWSQTPWTFDMLQIAYVYYGTTDKFGINETHGLMPWQVHEEFHQTVGTYLVSGGDIGGYTLASTTAAQRRPTVTSSTVQDEDLETVIASLATGSYTQAYLTGAGATPTWVLGAAEIVPVLAANPYYNFFTSGAWTQTLMPSGSYQAIWLVAVPTMSDATSQSYRYMWIQGQSQSATLATIQGLTPSSLNLSVLSGIATEWVFVGRVIIRFTGGNWSITQVDKLLGTKSSTTTLPAGTYLSAVATDTNFTGDGTTLNPLALSTTPALGTPSALVGTNITGTAAGLTAGAVAVSGITGLGTGVATALAVAVGSAGAPVVNGGALGTPSSGSAANLTSFPTLNQNTTGTAGGLTGTPNISVGTVTASGNVKIGPGTANNLRTYNISIAAGSANQSAAVTVDSKGTGVSTLHLGTGDGSGWDLNYNDAGTDLGFYLNGTGYVARFSSTGLAVTGALSATTTLSTSDTTDATSTTAASLKTAGGLAVAKKAYFGDVVEASGFRSYKGDTGSIANGTPTTILALTLSGLYTVFAKLPAGDGSPSTYSSSATVLFDSAASRITTNNGSALLLSLSGNNIQVQQNSGDSFNVLWSAVHQSL